MTGKFPKFGELNSVEHSQDAESLEPDNLDGLDLISINNSKTTKPNVIKKIIGPFKGMVLKGVGDVTTVNSGGSLFDFVFGKNYVKHRIRIPEIHSHLPEPADYDNVEQTIASLYPEFIAVSTDSNECPEVKPGTVVWCNFLDRENMQEPVYLGPVDKQAAASSGGGGGGLLQAVASAIGLTAGSSATGDSPTGVQSAGQQIPSVNTTDYNIGVDLQPGSPNKDVVEAALSYPDGAGGQYNMQGSGVMETILHKGETVLAYTGSTYCSGATFTIAMKVINKRNLFANKTLKEVKSFQRMWYGASSDPALVEKQQGPALEMMGIGGNVTHAEALPGDFGQIWRTNNSGHSVVFMGWEEKDGKIIGFKYRSSQGKGVGSGVSNRKEFFSDSGKGSVIRERFYLSRIKV
jgi:hypothetical protein